MAHRYNYELLSAGVTETYIELLKRVRDRCLVAAASGPAAGGAPPPAVAAGAAPAPAGLAAPIANNAFPVALMNVPAEPMTWNNPRVLYSFWAFADRMSTLMKLVFFKPFALAVTARTLFLTSQAQFAKIWSGDFRYGLSFCSISFELTSALDLQASQHARLGGGIFDSSESNPLRSAS